MSVPRAGAAWPAASTRPVALLGWPARHSLSPVVHNAAFAALDLDLVYLALPTRPDDLAAVVRALGAVGAVGANVTVPHKLAVMACCDRLTAEAELIGAVNTLVWGDGGLEGDNTDALGLAAALEEEVDLATGDEVVVLGTGGAARAAAVAVARAGASVTVVGRRIEAARALAALGERTGAAAARSVALDHTDRVRAAVAACRVAINATPLGLHGEALPEPFHELGPGQVAYDLVYGGSRSPFLADATSRGAVAHDGLGMLVGQAAGSFGRWTGAAAPLAVMRAAAAEALAERTQQP